MPLELANLRSLSSLFLQRNCISSFPIKFLQSEKLLTIKVSGTLSRRMPLLCAVRIELLSAGNKLSPELTSVLNQWNETRVDLSGQVWR